MIFKQIGWLLGNAFPREILWAGDNDAIGLRQLASL